MQVRIESQCEWRCNTWRKVSFEIETTKSSISNTRRSVSFNIQTREGVFYLISKHEKECFIWYPNTRKSVLFDTQTLRSDISNTRSVSFDIQTRGRVFYLISKQREIMNETREGEGVFHFTFRRLIYQARDQKECFIWEWVFLLIPKHQEVINQTWGVFIRYLITEK